MKVKVLLPWQQFIIAELTAKTASGRARLAEGDEAGNGGVLLGVLPWSVPPPLKGGNADDTSPRGPDPTLLEPADLSSAIRTRVDRTGAAGPATAHWSHARLAAHSAALAAATRARRDCSPASASSGNVRLIDDGA